jgi:L-rhamnose isomerase / sugar isomerase
MIDQSHNVTDPSESLLSSAEAICSAFVKALMVEFFSRRSAHRAETT